MRIKSNNKRKKTTIVVAFLLVAAAIACVSLLYISGYTNKHADKNEKNTHSTKADDTGDVDQQQKKNTDDSVREKEEFLDKQKDNTSRPDQETVTPTIDISASSDADTIVVSTKLFEIDSGKCELSISSGGSSVVKSADILYAPEFSTCAGFSINKNDLPSGTWTVQLNVASSTGKHTKSIKYEVQ